MLCLPMKLHFICVFLLLRRTETCLPIHFRACSHQSCSVIFTGGVHSDMTTPQMDLASRQNISSTVGLHTNLICGNKRAPTNALTVISVPIILVAVVEPTNNSLGGVSAVRTGGVPKHALLSSSLFSLGVVTNVLRILFFTHLVADVSKALGVLQAVLSTELEMWRLRASRTWCFVIALPGMVIIVYPKCQYFAKGGFSWMWRGCHWNTQHHRILCRFYTGCLPWTPTVRLLYDYFVPRLV